MKLSFCVESKRTSGSSYDKDNKALDAFLLGRMKNTIDTTLQVSKEARVVVESFVGSND